MANEVQYKFLDIDGVNVFKEELNKVVDVSEQNAKTHADGVASTAESNAKEYTDTQIVSALEWGEF